MKTNRFLFPACFRKIGWIISLPLAAVLGYYIIDSYISQRSAVGDFIDNVFYAWNLLNIDTDFLTGSFNLSVCMLLLLAGLLFIAFSREKVEDEFIVKLRGDSLIWAVIANSILLAAAIMLIYGGNFLLVLFLNLYTLLILFIAKYTITLHRFKKSGDHEE